jgi:hypothetical protein
MIDPSTGDVVFQDGTRIGRDLTLDAFVWTSPLHKIAKRGEGAAEWTSWRFEAELANGGRFFVCLRFKDQPLDRIELVLPWDGAPFVPEPAWKAAHDRYIVEVLGANAPLKFPWGRVDSIADDRSGDCIILVRYGA